jgi:hypothetical protein
MTEQTKWRLIQDIKGWLLPLRDFKEGVAAGDALTLHHAAYIAHKCGLLKDMPDDFQPSAMAYVFSDLLNTRLYMLQQWEKSSEHDLGRVNTENDAYKVGTLFRDLASDNLRLLALLIAYHGRYLDEEELRRGGEEREKLRERARQAHLLSPGAKKFLPKQKQAAAAGG